MEYETISKTEVLMRAWINTYDRIAQTYKEMRKSDDPKLKEELALYAKQADELQYMIKMMKNEFRETKLIGEN